MFAGRRGTTIALFSVVGILAAACGDDDGEESSATSAAEEQAATTEASEETTTSAAAERATTTAGRASTTGGSGQTASADASGFGTGALIGGGPYGQDPDNADLYTGAGGFQLDLADCPGDYEPSQGITESEIRIGMSLPRSGPIAGFGLTADGMLNYFKYVNEEKGGAGGRQIVLDVTDDAYEPARTQVNVDQMLQSGDYAGFFTILGTPNNLGVWDELNEECMPELLTGSGAAHWGDVENHPWTTGMILDYVSEAGLWAEWIKSEFPDGATVAAVTYNNDFGKQYAAGFKRAIQGTNITVVIEEFHEAQTPNLTNQFTSLAASNADVLLIETTGAFCSQAMAEVEKGSWKPQVMMSATCASISQFFQPLVDQGLTGEGTHVVQYYKDPVDVAFDDDPFIQLFRERAAADGLDPKQTTYFLGWVYAWYAAEVINLASTLEGGLTRPNLVIANRSMEAQNPGMLEGLTGRMEGLKDAYLTEGGQVVEYTVTDKSQLGSFEPVSELINNEGVLGTFASVQL